MSKYYTPSIEEFHVGFEYEFLTPQSESDGLYGGEWEKCTFNRDDEIVKHFKYNRSETRVKYLDREDIESLGWEYGEIAGNPYYTKGKAMELVHQPDGTVLISKDVRNHNVVFKGKLKNKTELSKLMKQLGI